MTRLTRLKGLSLATSGAVGPYRMGHDRTHIPQHLTLLHLCTLQKSPRHEHKAIFGVDLCALRPSKVKYRRQEAPLSIVVLSELQM